MLKFDLQVFAEDDNSAVEIPEELEGISPEIAAEIMKELPVEESESKLEEIEEAQEQESPTTEGTELENQSATEVKNESAHEEKKPPASIPYERFKEVNEKQKAASEEVARLKAELESFKKQPEANPLVGTKEQSTNPENIPMHLTPVFTDIVRNEARNRAKVTTGFTDEQISAFESEYAEDTPEKRKWESSIQAQVPLVAVEAQALVQKQEAQEVEQQRVYKLAHDEYGQLAETVKAWPDKEAVWNHICGAYFASLSEGEQIALSTAYANAESNRGGMQDVQYVKYHLNKAATDYRSMQKTTTKEKPKQNKLEQIKAHPRSEQISGSSNSGEVTVADLERMMNTTPWEKIPPEYQEILLGQ